MSNLKTFAVKVYGMTDEEAQSLYKKTDDGKDVLVDNFTEILSKKDAERLARIEEGYKQKLTDIHDKGYQKAHKESQVKFEKDVKDKYGLDTDKIGIELIDEIVSQASAGSQNKDIKTHPDYIKLERSLQTEFVPKVKFEEVNTQFDQFKKDVEKNQVLNRVKEDARKVFRSLKPKLSIDPKRASNQEADFLGKLETFGYQLQEDGNHVIIKDGSRLENEHKNPIMFTDFVKHKASEYFDFEEQSSKGSSGVDGGSANGSSVVFKDLDEFRSRYNKEFDANNRIKMMDIAKAQGLVK